ncbi:MAG: flagellar filament capping protein FliD [Mariprofundaceae bacterium]
MVGTVNIAGLASNIDWNATVDALMNVESRKVTLLEQRQLIEVSKQEAFSELSTKLLALRTTSREMNDSASFFSYSSTLTSSDSAVSASSLLGVQAGTDVVPGTTDIIVQQLAEARKIHSASAVQDSGATAAGSITTVLGLSGSFQIQGQSVNVSATDTLQDIQNSINALNSGASATGVSASIIKVADSDFRLILTSETTGVTGFTMTGADLSGSLSGLGFAAGGTVVQAGQDAQLSVDGITINRSSNVIDDAIAGLTFTLNQADPATTVQVGIGLDTAAAKTQIEAFVDAYNAIQTFITEQNTFNPDTQESGVLAGESVLGNIQNSMTSSILASVPGLAGDRNRLVLVGIEPDATGQLTIDTTKLDSFLATDPNAIRDVFAANATATTGEIQFLIYGDNTVSGNYALNITQAATKATVTGSTDLSAGLAADQTLTITETASSSQGVVALTAGMTAQNIADALNTEFAQVYTDQHQMDTALTAGGSPIVSSDTFSALGLGVTAGDTITITGTKRTGVAVSSTFSVLDPTQDNMADLLAAIQTAFDQQAIASIDASGRIVVTDATSGNSQMTFLLTANNEGAGTLDFGAASTVTEGRYALGQSAAVSGNFVTIEHNNYGSSSSFSVAQSVDGLGITDGTFTGVDVAGTINGETATGNGQMLIGNSGNADGLALLYTGSGTGSVGSFDLGMGIGAAYDNLIDRFANPATGIVQSSIKSSQDVIDQMQLRIEDFLFQIEKQREQLLRSFAAMEAQIAILNSTSQWLTQQTTIMQNNRI